MPPFTFFYGILFETLIILIVVSIPQEVTGAPGPTIKCASRCNCNETVIRCTEKEITKVPDFRKVTTHPKILDISSNDIEEITTTNFFEQTLVDVEELYLGDNSIFNIEVRAFSSLSNLKRLDISNNLLEELPSQVIRNNEQLTELNLCGNLFKIRTPKLSSTSLQILDLSFCKITVLEEENLKDLPELKILYVHANSLSHIDYNIFENVKLSFIDLSYNPWKCNCNTIELFNSLVQAGLTKIENPIQCMHSNKWYEDFYGSSGPIHEDKLCNKRAHPNSAPKNVTNKSLSHEVTKEELDDFEHVVQYEILFVVVLSVCGILVVALAILFLIFRKYETQKYAEVKTSVS